MVSQSMTSTTSAYPIASSSYAQAHPIDLTQDDSDNESYVHDRLSKRTCTSSRNFNACPSSVQNVDLRLQTSGLSPAMSTSTLLPPIRNLPFPEPQNFAPTMRSNPVLDAVRSVISGPSSSPFFQPQRSPSTPPAYHVANVHSGSSLSLNPSGRQIIDLTASPSPPPLMSRPPLPQDNFSSLPPELPQKTPVCIGLLTVTALVLYPIPYLQTRDPGAIDADWAVVRLTYEDNEKNGGGQHTIHIKTPNIKTLTGETSPGEDFGVVEQKVATVLGPMMGKGLIRLEGKVRKGLPHLPILPLQLLVYTPKGNITRVSEYLYRQGLLLDHPNLQTDQERLKNYYYVNLHNPPPGGHSRALVGPHTKTVYTGPGSGARWNTPTIPGKSVEVQRSQVDELFRNLKDGDDLQETESPPQVATRLYPHQKKALTFLLEREREHMGSNGKFSTLWQERQNTLSGRRSWHHMVTQREVFQEPQEAKGAILADDMGLGKTITCVSLIAATIDSARQFAATPFSPFQSLMDNNFGSALTAAHFAGSVWGMPEGPSEFSTAKGKAKATKDNDKVEAEYARNCRIKIKSRATLIICPLSTVSNWEDQFREHWKGEVNVVGGGGGMPSTSQPIASGSARIVANGQSSQSGDVKQEVTQPRLRSGTPLRVYVYHGNARRPDPTFLADFDAVITTYSTLASEFSKQTKSLANGEGEEDDDDDGSSDGITEVDDRGNPTMKLPNPKKSVKKRKKGGHAGMEATSPLQSVHWFRVVLDEAHCIKETSTVGCRASCDLIADRRLCLTGTPVQNKLDDVFALIKFLRIEPFDDKSTWTEFIGAPVKYGQSLGIARLQAIMKCITLRRTKESKAENGERILALPPRRDEIRYLQFDQQEQAIYDQFFNESKAEFTEMSKQNEVMKNYVGILQKILRLRQICDHFELVRNKGLGLIGDFPPDPVATYDDVVATIMQEGINAQRAGTIFALLRESGLSQCVECGAELGYMPNAEQGDGLGDPDGPSTAPKRGRKPKISASRASTRQSSPSLPQPVLTRCQHLFCINCFRNCIWPGWPNVQPGIRRCCSACQFGLSPSDAVEVSTDCSTTDTAAKKRPPKKEKRVKGIALENFHPSTKVKALMNDLQRFSRSNPHSVNYDSTTEDLQMVDDLGNDLDDGIVKTVVFSQWTTMLDKVEDALEISGIRYDRLDGTMKREERTRAMEALKHDPGCEVLLVSLKAGGVGLNLTAAQRVYLMDPYWNPAVENQAVDRIHRLGQTRPVTTVKLIIENSIEARLLEVQRKKSELANMTLGGNNFSKAELLQRRMEELQQLFGS